MTTTARAELHHVEVTVADAPAVTHLLTTAFGAVAHDPWLLLGRTRLCLRQGASGRALTGLGLRTDDVDVVRRDIEDAGMTFADGEDEASLRLRAEDWGGVPLVVGTWPRGDNGRTPADGNVIGVDHVGVASSDNAGAERRFCDVLGLRVESRQTDTETMLRVEQFTSDTYGVRVATSPVAQTGLRVLFVSLGDTDLELLEDLADGAAERGRSSSTAGDTSAISRYIDRFGPGLHHLALRVRDIDTALEQARRAGATLLDERGRPGSRRAQIAFLEPRSTARVLFHFVQR